MSQMKLKVCGMNDEQNLISLLQIPIDFVGFVFHEQSPRNLSLEPEKVNEIFINAEYKAKRVGVFVNKEIDFILERVENYELDYVQLHGNESLFYCESLQDQNVKIIKAFSIDKDFCFSNTEAYKYFTEYFLFDTRGKQAGGNGVKFNWDSLKDRKISNPFFLSGGISRDDVNIIRNLELKQLFAVDINSKFELAPGVKNLEEVSEFNYRLKKARPKNEYVNVKRNERI